MYTYNKEKKVIEDLFSDKPVCNMKDDEGNPLPAADSNGEFTAQLLNEAVYGIKKKKYNENDR